MSGGGTSEFPWRTLGDEVPREKAEEICGIFRGQRVVRKNLSDNQGYPVYQNSMIPLGYHSEYNCKANTTFVIAAGAAGEVGFSDKKFWAADDCYYFCCPDFLNNKFLYYFLKSKNYFLYANVRRASVPRLSRLVLEKMEIPIPSLEEQKRIVDILDKFDALINDLSQGLPAEIEARRKQYEYYRDKLLTFEER